MIVHSGKSCNFFLSGCYFFGYCWFLTNKPDQYEFFPAMSGVGKIRQFEDKKITGSELVFEDQAVHTFILSWK